MTFSATTSQHVLGQASFAPGAGPSSALLPASAERPEPPLPSTSGFEISMLMPPGRMSAALKSLLTGLRSGAARNLQFATLVSPLSSAGAPRRSAGRTAGAALALARKAKERTYPELRQSVRCKLVVLALELGGRWSTEAATFVRLLARLRSRAVPASSRGPSISAFTARWSALLSFAAARAFAASLLSLPLGGTANVDGEPPLLSDILAESSLELPLASRMP